MLDYYDNKIELRLKELKLILVAMLDNVKHLFVVFNINAIVVYLANNVSSLFSKHVDR